MHDELRITVEHAPDSELYAELARAVHAYGEPFVGVVDSRRLGVVVRDAAGDLLGGITGRTVLGHFLIDVLFVDEALRGRGVGRELMARAEAEARNRGCHGAQVDTLSFQAPRFYQQFGFEVIGTVPDFPAGHERYFLHKRYT